MSPRCPALSPLACSLFLAILSLPTAAAAATATSPASEAGEARRLDRIEVRGEALAPMAPLSLEAARKRLAERAGGTAVIDGERYRQGRVSTLNDALGFAAGVFVQPRFGAEESRLSIRGSGLQRTFHGRGIVVLQDGIPVNLADGGFDMQSLDALMARYIEVWRGPNALEHGAATLGGPSSTSRPLGTTPRAGACAARPGASVTAAGRRSGVVRLARRMA
ncbi:MAG: hypothetical protein KatS3mg128_0954 [Silanimonas sp.]|nr:MAG: hypothetical protein KatS3mg128_0954 [Silanimonas sp.]